MSETSSRASAAGMKTVAATYGYLGEKERFHPSGADFHIHAPKELLQLLAKA
jgi:phosphoglycolate phosphatase-like HAD superfamily hydrolase